MEQPDSYDFPTVSLCFRYGFGCDSYNALHCLASASVGTVLENGFNKLSLGNITNFNEVSLG